MRPASTRGSAWKIPARSTTHCAAVCSRFLPLKCQKRQCKTKFTAVSGPPCSYSRAANLRSRPMATWTHGCATLSRSHSDDSAPFFASPSQRLNSMRRGYECKWFAEGKRTPGARRRTLGKREDGATDRVGGSGPSGGRERSCGRLRVLSPSRVACD